MNLGGQMSFRDLGDSFAGLFFVYIYNPDIYIDFKGINIAVKI